MSVFDMIGKLSEIADNPNLGQAADAIGKTAIALPDLLASIDASLKQLVCCAIRQDGSYCRIISVLEASSMTLREISMGLDAMADPVKRPPFHATDVEAMMAGRWPPCLDEINDEGEGAPKDCTNLKVANGKRTESE